MLKKFLLLAGIVLAVLAFVPMYTSAAQTSRTLRAGQTYRFEGTDARVVSHVNVSSGARFEMVQTNARGEVTNFGFFNWRFSISGTGQSIVTPLANMTITFDSSRVRLTEVSGTALTQVNLRDGQTINISNYGMVDTSIRTNRANDFDYVIITEFYEIHNFDREVRLPLLNIPSGGRAIITADGDLTVYFPSILADNVLSSSIMSHPGMVVFPMVAGEVYNMTNRSREALNPAVASDAGAMFRYEFTIRGSDGHIANYGSAITSQIRINPEQSMTITPLVNGEMIFPYFWDFVIGRGEDFPLYHALAAGDTFVISNVDERFAHTIIIRSLDEDEDEISYDVVMYYDEEFTFVTGVTGGRLQIPAGAYVTLTADPEGYGLAISFPYTPYIVMERGDAALSSYVFEPGDTIIFHSIEDVIVQIDAEQNFTMDFILFFDDDDYQEPFEFGRRYANPGMTRFNEGEILKLTNTSDETIVIIAPYVWFGELFTIEASDTPALFRQVIEEGQSFYINNVDRDYNHIFLIEHEQGRMTAGTQLFDYVLTHNRTILAYGMSNNIWNSIPANSRMEIAPARGQVVSIAFPSEWYGQYLRVAEAANQPLHRIVLRPGQRITIYNNTRDSFYLSTNATVGGAGFFLRRQNQTHRITADEVPLRGQISLPARTNVTITASSGADLEIWMPRSRAVQLRLV